MFGCLPFFFFGLHRCSTCVRIHCLCNVLKFILKFEVKSKQTNLTNIVQLFQYLVLRTSKQVYLPIY